MKIKTLKILSCSLILGFMTLNAQASSENIKSPSVILIKPNVQASIHLSISDMNRIYIENEKIKAINFSGNMLSAHNDNSGGIYINIYEQRPFTAFVSTNKGLHFSLFIIPKSIPGQTIEFKDESLKSTGNHICSAIDFHSRKTFELENTVPYERRLIHLIKDAELKVTPAGYTNIDPHAFNEIQALKINDALPDQLKESIEAGFLGGKYAIRVIKVSNDSLKPIDLYEHEFYSTSVKAIAILQRHLNPHQKTDVFEAVENV